jgi:hypothetical protein
VVDFRYHALSLVAVFLALGIGIVLGVTVGDSLVSDADRNLRESLRDEVTDAREEARQQADLATAREGVVAELLPVATRRQLRGRRVALVASGELPDEVEDAFEDAILRAGGSVHSKTVLEVTEDLDALGRYVPARRRLRTRIVPGEGDTDAARLGGRVGRAIVLGERGLRRLRAKLPDRFKGRYRGRAEGVVVYRHPPPEPAHDQESDAELRETFDGGLLEGLSFGQPLVGVETSATDPSQVGWYGDSPIIVASVDNLDVAEGELALVYVLANPGIEAVEGAFGSKESADRTIPDPSD